MSETPYGQGDFLDKIILGGVLSPGVVKLDGHDRNKNWDIQKAKGKTGATTVLNGDDPADFTATFYLAEDDLSITPNDFDQWKDFRRLIDSTVSGPKPVALPIWHPDLAEQNIILVTSGGVKGGKHDGLGGKTYVVRFLEYKPAKAKTASTAAAKPGQNVAGASPKPDPNAGAKAQLAGLLAIAKQP